VIPVALAAALVLGGCAGEAEGPGDEPTPTVEPEDPGTDGDGEEPESPEEPADGDATVGPDGMPGEESDRGPSEGDQVAVIGVEVGDHLNLRFGPGVDFHVVERLAPTASGVEATGRNRVLDDGSTWTELTVGTATGWVNSAFLAYLGRVDDITSQLSLPSGEDLAALGEQVGQQRAGGDGEGEASPTVVVVDGPHQGDLDQVVVDVVGFADDSILGERLRVFAVSEGGTFTVRTVESQTLCARGVDGELCL
jgi:hypothetical protein